MNPQPLKLTITDITESNRHEKLVVAAYALSEQMGIDADVYAPPLEKAKTHKYISKEWKNDRWEYNYAEDGNSPGNIASQKAEIPTINAKALNGVNEGNYKEIASQEMKKLQAKIKQGLFCTALGGKRVIGAKEAHLSASKGKPRTTADIIRRIGLMPFIIPIIEQGIKTKERKNPKYTGNYYEVSGRDNADTKISVILADKNDGYLYISVIDKFNKKVMKKAIIQSDSPDRPQLPNLGFPSRHWDSSLPSSGYNYIIPQISAKSIQEYPNLEVLIKGVTGQNKKLKFAKAMRAVSSHLKLPLGIRRKAETRAGEPYMYPIQQELSDQWTGFYQGITKKIYSVVIAAMGLPPVAVETMRKALRESDKLKYRGRVIYNPQTGLPLKNKDFDDLIEAIQKFLNRNTKDIAKQILLDSVAIGKLLRRMAKYQSSADMKRLKLDDMKYRGKTFDWIRNDIKNLTNVLGQPLSGPEMARYQVGRDYIGHLVTRSNNRIRDDIKDTILDGIINKRTKSQVSQDLFNRLGGLNRDWKRIADTEIVNTSNLASILHEVKNTPENEKIYFKRYELPGCCKKCTQVNGMIALWSDTPLTDDKIKDKYAKVAIWEGKPQIKGKTVMVTGVLHPNCRGGWVRWGGKQVDVMMAQINGKTALWDKAVNQAKAEYKDKGIENPNDFTPGYVDRINELYKEKLGEVNE